MTILSIRSKNIVWKQKWVIKTYPIKLNDNLSDGIAYPLHSNITDLKHKLERILNCNIREIKEEDKQDLLLYIYWQYDFIEKVSLILNNVFRWIDRYSETISEEELNKLLCKCAIFL